MKRTTTRFILVPTGPTLAALLLAAALALPGCKSKKTLDKNVDKLVEAVQKDDYQAFKEMSHPDLVEKFPKVKFTVLSAAINSLGKFKDRKMRGIEVKGGGLKRGRYKLKFDKGTIRLRIELVDGKLTAFR